MPVGSKKKETLPLEEHGGYRLIQPWTTKGAGTSMWSFAEKGGKQYFIKVFVKPVLPSLSSGMSPALIERKRKACERFEQKKRRVYAAVNESATGNIVKIEDFFFDKTKFYLTTRKVEGKESDPKWIAALPYAQKMLFIKVLAYSILSLHRKGIVHGDLKPENVLVKQKENGNMLAKLIDFGESFLETEPSNELTGDVYLSPEGAVAIAKEEGSITRKADVFALGLMFHAYYTGELPRFDASYDYAYEALLNGGTLILHPMLNSVPDLREAIEGMLRTNPEERLSMEEVYALLSGNTPRRRAVPGEEQERTGSTMEQKRQWQCSNPECHAQNPETTEVCLHCGRKRSRLKRKESAKPEGKSRDAVARDELFSAPTEI